MHIPSGRRSCRLALVGVGSVAVFGLVVASASVAGALFGGTVNSTYGAATYTIPKTHVAPSAKIHIASFAPGEFSQYGGTAILTGSLAAASTTGQENVSCNLLLTGTGPSETGTAVIWRVLPGRHWSHTEEFGLPDHECRHHGYVHSERCR